MMLDFGPDWAIFMGLTLVLPPVTGLLAGLWVRYRHERQDRWIAAGLLVGILISAGVAVVLDTWFSQVGSNSYLVKVVPWYIGAVFAAPVATLLLSWAFPPARVT